MRMTVLLILLLQVFTGCNVAKKTVVPKKTESSSTSSTDVNAVLPVIYFANTLQTYSENNGTQSVRLQRSVDLSDDLTVKINLFGSATYGVDYGTLTVDGVAVSVTGSNPQSFSFTYPKNKSSVVLAFTLIDDTRYEGLESISFAPDYAAGTYRGTSNGNYRVSLLDDDVYPVIGFAAATSTSAEGTAVSLTLNATNASDSTIIIPFNVTGNITSADHDLTTYYAVIAAGSTSTTINFNLTDDTAYEIDETMIFTIGTPSNAALDSSAATHTLTITDMDGNPTFSFSASTGTLTNEGTLSSYSVTLTLTGVIDETLTVPVGLAGSTAQNNVDFTLSKSVFSFAPGTNPTDTIIVKIKDDKIYEGNETIVLTAAAVAKAGVGANGTLTLTLVDDEAPPTYQFLTSTAHTAEGQTYKLKVVASHAASVNTTFTYNVDAASTASYPADHSLNTGPLPALVMTAGQTVAELAIYMKGDTVHDPDETLIFNLTASSIGSLSGVTTTTVTIHNAGVLPVLSFANSEQTVLEGNDLTLTLTLDKASAHNQEVSLYVSYLSASASDHVAFSSSYTITAGQTSKTITVNVPKDFKVEDDELMQIRIKDHPYFVMGPQTSQIVYIIENDDYPEITIDTTAAALDEVTGTTTYEFTVNLEAGYTIERNTRIPFTTFGSATYAIDYTLSNASYFTINKNETSSKILVTAINDNLHELISSEVVGITLTAPAADATYILQGGAQSHSITINDGHTGLEATTNNSVTTMYEGETRDLIIYLNYKSESTIYINPTFVAGTAAIGDLEIPSTYATITDQIIIPSGSSYAAFKVKALLDSIKDSAITETATFTFAPDALSPAVLTIPTNTATINIVDADRPLSGFKYGSNGITSRKISTTEGISLSGGELKIVSKAGMDNLALTQNTIRYTVEAVMLTGSELLARNGHSINQNEISFVEPAVPADQEVYDIGSQVSPDGYTNIKTYQFILIPPAKELSLELSMLKPEGLLYEGSEFFKLNITNIEICDPLPGLANCEAHPEYIIQSQKEQIIEVLDDEAIPAVSISLDSGGDDDCSTLVQTNTGSAAEGDFPSLINQTEGTLDPSRNDPYVCVSLEYPIEHQDVQVTLSTGGTASWVPYNITDSAPYGEAFDRDNDGTMETWISSWQPKQAPDTSDFVNTRPASGDLFNYLNGDYILYTLGSSVALSKNVNNSSFVQTFSIPKNTLYQTLVIEIARDYKDEEDESLTISIETANFSTTNLPISSSNEITYTITDDDTAPYLGMATFHTNSIPRYYAWGDGGDLDSVNNGSYLFAGDTSIVQNYVTLITSELILFNYLNSVSRFVMPDPLTQVVTSKSVNVHAMVGEWYNGQLQNYTIDLVQLNPENLHTHLDESSFFIDDYATNDDSKYIEFLYRVDPNDITANLAQHFTTLYSASIATERNYYYTAGGIVYIRTMVGLSTFH